jgi:predicted ATPase
MLATWSPPAVQHPTIASLQPPQKSFFSFFSSEKPTAAALPPIPTNLPKGMYMYGDVGSGKTMMMDLFYDTLPPNITHKTRVHFHAFMQGVHKDLHKMKMAHGSDLDAIQWVAAGIAERSSVLCFDEFQCTDVADAMILRRLIESLMTHGTVIVTTSNRHPNDLYKNGIQRESFIPLHQPPENASHSPRSRQPDRLPQDPAPAIWCLSPPARRLRGHACGTLVPLPG